MYSLVILFESVYTLTVNTDEATYIQRQTQLDRRYDKQNILRAGKKFFSIKESKEWLKPKGLLDAFDAGMRCVAFFLSVKSFLFT